MAKFELTHLQPVSKEVLIQEVLALVLLVGRHVAVKDMLDGDLAPILLAEQTANDGVLLVSEGVSGDVVGDGEEHERMEDDLELGAALRGEERVGGALGVEPGGPAWWEGHGGRVFQEGWGFCMWRGKLTRWMRLVMGRGGCPALSCLAWWTVEARALKWQTPHLRSGGSVDKIPFYHPIAWLQLSLSSQLPLSCIQI